MPPLSRLFVEFRASTSQFAADMQQIQREVREFDKILKPIKTNAENVGKALTASLTVPIAAGAALAAKAGIEYESAFAGVRKTVNATEAELAALSDQFRSMAREIPVAATELANIGQAAGQLGIKKENIAEFAKTMAAMGVATNLSSTQAATSLARFANITQFPQSQIKNLGSTIVALGNNMATTESEILDFGLRIAGAGHQVGLTEAQILGIGAALSSVGIEAEAGGTAISRVLIDMSVAAAEGGQKLETLARVAGVSAGTFAERFQTDAAGATLQFIEGLDRMGKAGVNLFPILDELGLDNIRVRDALLRSAGAGDLLRKALDLSTNAFRENSALTKEATERYKTTASQLQLLKNDVTEIGITLFEALGPILRDTVIPNLRGLADMGKAAADGFNALPDPLKNTAVEVAAAAAALGPALYLFGKIQPTLTGAIVALNAFRIAMVQANAIALSDIRTYKDLGTAIELIGESSLIAKAGLVGLAALAGHELGNLANSAIEGTAVRGAIDESTEAVRKYGAALGPVGALIRLFFNEPLQSAQEFAAANDLAADRLRAMGVVVERGKLSESEFAAALARSAKELRDKTHAAEDAEKARLDEQTKRNAEAAKRHAEALAEEKKALDALAKQFAAAFAPADELNRELDRAIRLGKTDAEILAVYGGRILDAAAAQRSHGIAVAGTVSRLEAHAYALQFDADQSTEAEEAAKRHAAAVQAASDEIRQALRPAEQLNEKLLLLDEARASDVDIVKVYGAEILRLIGIQESHGQAITGEVARLKELAQAFAGVARIADVSRESLELAMKLPAVDAAALDAVKQALEPSPAVLGTPEAPRGETILTFNTRKRMDEAKKAAADLADTIGQLREEGFDSARIMGALGSDIDAAAKSSEQFRFELDPLIAELADQADATQRAAAEARQWQQVWAQVLANITTDFARGMSDVIFQAKSLPGALADIAKTTGRAFTEAFFAELFSPLSNMMASWGRELARTLQTSVVPKIAGAIGVGALFPGMAGAASGIGTASVVGSISGGAVLGTGATAAGAGAAGGAGAGLSAASLGAFFTNPVTIGVGAAIGGVLLAKSLIGRGREAADKFGDQTEREFALNLTSVVDQFNSAREAGALTLQDALKAREEVAAVIRTYNAEAAEFAALGSAQRKVVEQALAGKEADFGRGFSRIFDDINEAIADLRKGSPGGPGLAETGRSYSASNIFASSVDRLVPAMDRFASGVHGGGNAQITIDNELHFHATVDGSTDPEEVIQRWRQDIRDNADGILAELATRLSGAMKGVTVSTA